MNKALKWILIALVALVVLAVGGMQYMKAQTKKHSPEAIVEHKAGEKSFSVFYCRPSKKERVIFGELVPYGEVWRTGANEATTFEISKDIRIDDQVLKAGKYTLWTIPEKNKWTIIFNSRMYDWGVGFDGVATREAEFDVISIEASSKNIDDIIEQFTIRFMGEDPVEMSLSWDQTSVSIPMY